MCCSGIGGGSKHSDRKIVIIMHQQPQLQLPATTPTHEEWSASLLMHHHHHVIMCVYLCMCNTDVDVTAQWHGGNAQWLLQLQQPPSAEVYVCVLCVCARALLLVGSCCCCSAEMASLPAAQSKWVCEAVDAVSIRVVGARHTVSLLRWSFWR